MVKAKASAAHKTSKPAKAGVKKVTFAKIPKARPAKTKLSKPAKALKAMGAVRAPKPAKARAAGAVEVRPSEQRFDKLLGVVLVGVHGQRVFKCRTVQDLCDVVEMHYAPFSTRGATVTVPETGERFRLTLGAPIEPRFLACTQLTVDFSA